MQALAGCVRWWSTCWASSRRSWRAANPEGLLRDSFDAAQERSRPGPAAVASLVARVGETVALADAVTALRELGKRPVAGKVVLDMTAAG